MRKPSQSPTEAQEHCLNCQPNRPAPTRTLIPIKEVLEKRLPVCRSTLYGLINDGSLERVHIGKRAFLVAESVDDFIDGLTRVGGEGE